MKELRKKQQVVNFKCYERRRPPSLFAELSPLPPRKTKNKQKQESKIVQYKSQNWACHDHGRISGHNFRAR